MKRPPEKSILKKLERLAQGHKPRVLDLFAGCGGISLGFDAAGFQIDAAVEIDSAAVETHARNFHSHLTSELLAAHMKPRDLTRIEPDELTEELSLGPVADAFDVVVGGPPCQAYARVGRAKLRDVADHPSAFKVDPRGNLYLRYLHFVAATQPLALLMENVPDAMNYGGHNVMAEVAEALDELGYVARYSLINTAFHGVPQMRDRVFLVAHHRSLDSDVRFPEAANHLILPPGYAGTRAVALKFIDLFDKQYFVEADHGDTSLPGPVTTQDALGDLPPITLHLEGKLKRGARRFNEIVPYEPTCKLTRYARLMRQWKGFEAPDEGLRDHVIRYLPRDTDIFRHMPIGGEYPAAHATAVKLWEKRVRQIERRLKKTLSEKDRTALYAEMVPPYPVSNFPNRWWKLRPDAPSRTLLAHIGKDTYSHIHYDSAQARVISVREAARLQSFPDGFSFSGTMNPAYRQIGNAVPPIMAKSLATTMMETLQNAALRRSKRLVAAE
ncbi:DNA (cytosine-5)-methyltransferase 1 [Bradyrhizobium sp. Ghvi]|uniref:DNA cytosine methyltransferase n=1 Tax=Bradyrhizobium sp. Ghvi TaxID=1855319 RepID=UPI0008EC9D15|nr:DNA cytosine methyltransferase [Bradyrhizobium sp. Ghvi]SFO03895.1 DNA (cytosine-5)-methyltransferase 1 [Bradyrhizobium sp. Ghvi]